MPLPSCPSHENLAKTMRLQGSPLDVFHSHFSAASQYGPERWHNSLYPALQRQTNHTALYNRYAPRRDFDNVIGNSDELLPLELPGGPDDAQDIVAYSHRPGYEDELFPPPQRSSNGLLTHWNLDAASLLPVRMLGAQPGERVLDLYAAPGGKSLALAQSIWPYLQPDSTGPSLPVARKGALHSNEMDPVRFARMSENLTACLPAKVRELGQQKVTNLDGTKGAQFFPLGIGGYDKVLLDAPCSSERDIVHAQARASSSSSSYPSSTSISLPLSAAEHVTSWSPTSSKRLAQTQLQLLLTALRAVRVGGKVVYATCSLSKEENEGVVEKALMQIEQEGKQGTISWKVDVEILGDEIERSLEEVWRAERLGKGWIVLPDKGTWGPLYFVSLLKHQL